MEDGFVVYDVCGYEKRTFGGIMLALDFSIICGKVVNEG